MVPYGEDLRALQQERLSNPSLAAAGAQPRIVRPRLQAALLQRVWRARRRYIALLPIFALLGLFSYYPPIMAIYYSVTDFNGVRAQFVGLRNFVQLTDDWIFQASVRNLIVLLFSGILTGIIPSLIVAELIYSVRSKLASDIYRTGFLIPTLVPGITVIMTWRYIYHYRYGLINSLLSAIGLDTLRHDWLGSYDTALPSLIFFGFPWIHAIPMLILLAALLDIPTELMDSFRLDSSSTLRRIRHLDLPFMLGAMRLVLIVTLIGTLHGFGLQFALTGGGPGTATTVPAYHMYRQAFHGSRFGYASAIGLLLFAVMLLLTVLVKRYLRSGVEYEAK